MCILQSTREVWTDLHNLFWPYFLLAEEKKLTVYWRKWNTLKCKHWKHLLTVKNFWLKIWKSDSRVAIHRKLGHHIWRRLYALTPGATLNYCAHLTNCKVTQDAMYSRRVCFIAPICCTDGTCMFYPINWYFHWIFKIKYGKKTSF